MHILYLHSTLAFGGAQKIIVGLAEEARKVGYDVTIVTLQGGNAYENRLEKAGISYHCLNFDKNYSLVNVFSIFQLRKKLIKLIIKINPNIIHSQLFLPKLVLYGMADIAGIPIMQTQQDNSPWWSKSNLKERLMSHIENNFARKTCKYTAAISIAVQEDVLRNTKLSKEEIPLIYNFMDSMPPTIVDRHKSINDEYIKIFMITRLNLKKKGLDIAVQIAKKLIERGKKRYQFIIVGDGFDRSKMEELVKIEKITPFFEFRGYQEDVYSQFKEAHIVLMPSRWEGFGITAAEAALSKVPVVASRIGGLQEVVIDNETGALCKVEDVNCFVQKIEMLTESDETYQSISKKAVIKAKERFNKTTIFNKYDIIYKKLVASANN